MKIDKLNLPIFLFTIAFFLEGLDAFSIFNIPLSWIGVVIYVLIPGLSHRVVISRSNSGAEPPMGSFFRLMRVCTVSVSL